MNLKPNLWTLLFVLAVGALFYTYNSNSAESAVYNPCNPDPAKSVKIVRIPDTTFQDQYKAYEEKYLSVMQDTSLHLDSLIGVKNLDIRYYKLAVTELEQMYCDYMGKGKPDVYVYPIIQSPTPDSNILELVFAMSDERGATSYFDFTAPCPTLCDE